MSSPLTRKVVLIAGASSGMGQATAIAAAHAGASVVLVARRMSALESLRDEIDTDGGVSFAVQGDATDEVSMRQAVDAAATRFGRLDALVNSVGTNIPERSLNELTRARWDALINTNLFAAFVLTQAALPQFREQRDGIIIHIASAAVKKPDQSGVAYQAAKAGVAGLAHATMEEERDNGVRVSVVFPGLTDTPLVGQRPTPVPPATMSKAMQPEDVAAICVALLALPGRAYVPEVSLLPSQL